MKINKDNILEEDKETAVQIINTLRNGGRVIGSPAQGLKETLKKLEEQKESVSLSKFEWELKDRELEDNISKLKAGIDGEIMLSEFLAQLLKYNDDLDGIIVFASLSQEQENNDKDYIPDSDFVLVHNDKFLIIDAKNISTNPDVPIHFVEKDIVTDTERPKYILEGVNSSVNVWKSFFEKYNISYSSIMNTVCIVNKTGATITDPIDSNMSLIHISELNNYLLNWHKMSSKNEYVRLYDLTQLSKCQIKKEKSGLDLSNMKKIFRV